MNRDINIQVQETSNWKMLKAMVGIGIMCALFIVLTFEGTSSQIKINKQIALEKAIFKVLPGITKKKNFILNANDEFELINNQEDVEQIVYAGYDEQDNLAGIAIEASGMGFADVIRILYGYDLKTQTIIGFHVLESKETPGLGDKIEKDDIFLANFEALDVSLTEDFTMLKNRVVPVKFGNKTSSWEVDGITGATISSRAIGNILGNSTSIWIPLIYKQKTDFIIQDEY